MKCFDLKYATLSSIDSSWYSYNFTDFESIPTKTDYTFVSMGFDPIVFDIYENIVLLWLELPNCLVHTDINNLGHYSKVLNKMDKIVKIFTNCPFSVDYFNRVNNFNKFQFAFAPINILYFPVKCKKIYDVFHTGNINNSVIKNCFPIIEKFNNCIVGSDYGSETMKSILNIPAPTPYINSLNTPSTENYGKMAAKALMTWKNQGASYLKKLKLNAQSKISIVHGLLSWPENNRKIAKEQYKNHGAFELVEEHGIVPQIKSRTFEAAASKSIILSLHDPWNMIESYFDTDEFVYWYDEKDLEEKIHHILNHYDDYQPMIEKAHDKVINNYTQQHFFDKYLKDL